MIKKIFATTVLAMFLGACSTIQVKPEPPAGSVGTTTLESGANAVVLAASPEFSNYRHVGSPDWGTMASMGTFEFHLGKPMAQALADQLSRISTSAPAGSVLVVPSIGGFRFGARDEPSGLKIGLIGVFAYTDSDAKMVAEIDLRLDATDAAGAALTSVAVTGKGVTPISYFSSRDVFAPTAQAAIGDAATKAVRQLLDDPAVRAKLGE